MTKVDGRFGWRGWLGVAVGLGVVGGFVALVLGLAWLAGLGGESPHPTPAVSHLSNRGYGYWFCWNRGEPEPHHLGHRSQLDHLCSEDELQQTTSTP